MVSGVHPSAKLLELLEDGLVEPQRDQHAVGQLAFELRDDEQDEAGAAALT